MDQEEILESEDQIESQNMSEVLQKDYYDKFKNGQNLYDPSITLSRLSLGEKTSEDYNNTTHVGMIQIQERLSDEIHKNQLLENKVAQLTKDLQTSMEHTTLLQKQNENYSDMIREVSTKLQKQIRNNEIEKLLNQQLNKKITELQEINNNYKQQILLLTKDQFNQKKNNQSHPKSNQSMCSSNRNKERMTEDSTVKDSSVSEQRSHENARFIESAQQFYKTQNFWSPQQHVSPKASNLERRIESTLAQIRSIKLQIQQYNQK